ncbi:unnamed protein product, partial [marine sediment metagenome]
SEPSIYYRLTSSAKDAPFHGPTQTCLTQALAFSTAVHNGGSGVSDNTPESTSHLPSRQDFDALVKKANEGNEDALAQLRQLLDNHPEIWQSVGDLAAHARMTMIRMISNGNRLLSESLHRKAEQMERELAGTSPTPLETLAVKRVVATWLELQLTDTIHPRPQGQTLKHERFALDLKRAAQRHFDTAVKSLALVRKMLPSQIHDKTAAALPKGEF